MNDFELSRLMLRLYGCVNQANFQDEIKILMSSAPVEAQKNFIAAMLGEDVWEQQPDKDDLIAARMIGE